MKRLYVYLGHDLVHLIYHRFHVLILRTNEIWHIVRVFGQLVSRILRKVVLLPQVIVDLLEPDALVLPNHVDVHLHLELQIVVKLLHALDHRVHQVVEPLVEASTFFQGHVLLVEHFLLGIVQFVLGLSFERFTKQLLYVGR